ncbi:P-loop ATPase, Sll1717 family, partial [Roseivivax isoporae]|uniref:P-loop ATPase, Sll1717 family n=1 Tax=Roseivivax isoporae TaxID=591206 RepID=UPI00138E3778
VETGASSKRQKLRWSEFVGVCEAVQAYVNHTIQEIPAGMDFFARVSAKLAVDEIVSSVIGVDQLDALSRCIYACSRHFVFALDGFDQRFEDFRSSNSIMSSMDGEEKDNRIQFEIGWLKGLLRSVLELRSSDEVVQDKIAFCITIPQDRYLEVRSTERDDYRYRALAANLQWSALELSILIRKRLEGLTTISSDKQLSPLDRLEEVLMAKELSIPRSIEMRVGGNVITLSFFKYLLRHTFWRPRDFIFYVAAILTNMKYSRKHSKVLDADLVKDIISRTTYDVIGTEFIKEFQSSITNIKKIIGAFDKSPITLSFEDFKMRVSRTPFLTSGGLIRLDDPIEKLSLLYEIGFIGVELTSAQMRGGGKSKDVFVFSDGMRVFESLSDEAKMEASYVIHPIFCEYLSLDSDVGRVVCAYSDEYIERNDVIHE